MREAVTYVRLSVLVRINSPVALSYSLVHMVLCYLNVNWNTVNQGLGLL